MAYRQRSKAPRRTFASAAFIANDLAPISMTLLLLLLILAALYALYVIKRHLGIDVFRPGGLHLPGPRSLLRRLMARRRR